MHPSDHHDPPKPGRPRRPFRRLMLGAVLALTAALGLSAAAEAATYYNIVNTDTGRALATDPSGKVRMVTPSRFALGQQFKLLDDAPTGEGFNSRIQNRLGTCLIDSQPLTFEEPFFVNLRHASCGNPLPSRITWSGLAGRLTGAPSIPGFQLVNNQTAYYALDFCFFGCPEFADLASAEFVGSDPREFSGAAKWQFRFAVSAA